MNELLKVEDVARLIKVPRKSVYLLIAEGKLRVVRLGRRLRFDPATVKEDLQKLRDVSRGK
jgi:excisionase family DNA binding protein